MSNNQNKTARASIFGALSGVIFFFGLAIAIAFSGHFWAILLATLAVTSLVGTLSSPNVQAIYGGFQGFVFLLGLAVLALTGWWWPGIFVLLGISTLLGALNVTSVANLLGLSFLTRASRKPQEAYQQPYQPYQEGYQPAPQQGTYQEGEQQYQYEPPASQQLYEQPSVQYPQEEMPPPSQ